MGLWLEPNLFPQSSVLALAHKFGFASCYCGWDVCPSPLCNRVQRDSFETKRTQGLHAGLANGVSLGTLLTYFFIGQNWH